MRLTGDINIIIAMLVIGSIGLAIYGLLDYDALKKQEIDLECSFRLDDVIKILRNKLCGHFEVKYVDMGFDNGDGIRYKIQITKSVSNLGKTASKSAEYLVHRRELTIEGKKVLVERILKDVRLYMGENNN